jgi:hypothetical protein
MNNQFELDAHRIKSEPFCKMNEESLAQIEIHNYGKDQLNNLDDSQLGYEDPRWIEKSKSIKARDGYTCQVCKAVDLMQGGLFFFQQGDYETYHHYEGNSSRYEIHVPEFHMTINIDFYPGYHLTMPRLNVHHKIYYKNRSLWDYQDDCLVTLCENCHHYLHSLKDFVIPIVEELSDGNSVLIGKTTPKPYKHILDHTDLGTFIPWALVKENRWGEGLKGQDLIDYKRAKSENKKWYEYQEVLDNHVMHINVFARFDPRVNKHTPEETKPVAEFIIYDFIENILGFRKK